MRSILLLTNSLQPSVEVLPALGLLPYTVKVLPAEGTALLESPPVDAVLVDGRVAATWTVDGARLLVTPLRRLTRSERDEVAEEAHGLAGFLDRGITRVAFTAPAG